jgi:DNA-binding IclR family transcriptional regulator
MVVLESVHGGYPVRLVVDTGSRLPAHLTAGGKALLARITEAEVRQIYQAHKLQIYTPRSLRTVDELLAELAIVRERRWAQTDQEFVDGIKSIGVSFCPISEPTMFALSVSFPLGNVTKIEASAVQATLMRVAEDLGHTLGDPQWSQVKPHSAPVEKVVRRKPQKKKAKPRLNLS